MSFKNISARYTADTTEYSSAVSKIAAETRSFAEQAAAAGRAADQGWKDAAAGTASYTESVKVAAVTEKSAAEANVAAAVKRRESLSALREEYIRLAATAEEGSATQIAAMRLEEVAAKRLGEVKAAAAAEQGGGSIGGLIENKLAALTGQSKLASKALDETGVSATGTSAAIAGMSTGAMVGVGALLALAVGAEQGVQKLTALGMQTLTTQRITGASAEDASRFNGELKLVGVNSEAATTILGRFTKNIQDHADQFDKAGVSIAHYRDGTTNVIGTLNNVREKMLGTADATQRASFEAAVMGRGFLALGPWLNTTTETMKGLDAQLQHTGQVIGQDTVDQSLQLTRSMRLLGADISGVEVSLGSALLPKLVVLADDAAKAGEKVSQLAQFLGLAGTAQTNAAGATEHHASVLERFSSGFTSGFLGNLVPGIGLLNDLTNAQTKHSATTGAMIKAQDDQAASARGLSGFVDLLRGSEDTATLEGTKLITAAEALRTKFDALGAPIGMAGNELLQFGTTAAEVEAKTKAIATAVQTAQNAFSKDFSSTTAFGATALDAAAKSSTTAANTMVKDDTRVADAIAHVADLQAQYADQAAKAKEAYAAKVATADQAMSDADQKYADTVDTENQHVADADQKLADARISSAQTVADAKARLNEDDANSAQSVADATQRYNDLLARQAAHGDPKVLAQLSAVTSERDAVQAIQRARDSAADKHQQDVDNVTKAQVAAVKTVATAQDVADKARITQVKAVETAEDAVIKARDAENKLAEEGKTVGQQTLQQQVEMRKAVEAVSTAQRSLGTAMDGAQSQQREAIKLTTADVAKFYSDSTTEGKKFSEGIRTAIAQGYDPAFIERLLEEGPKQAAPFLELITGQNNSTLKDMVNKGEETLRLQGLHMADMAQATKVAVETTSAQTRQDYGTEMKALQALAENGGHLTAQALADKLGVGVADVLRIAGEYGGALKTGIDPLLAGIGAPPVPYQAPSVAAGPFHAPGQPNLGFADGGMHLPREAMLGNGRTKVQWDEPETQGEYFIPRAPDRRPRSVALLSQAADDFGYTMLRKFADGGFILPGDVPKPPDFAAQGTMLGYSANKTDQHLYDAMVAFVAAHPPAPAGGFGGGGTGSGYGWQAITHYLDMMHQAYTITSTVRNGGGKSRHDIGMAVDLVGDMPAIARTLMGAQPALYELIHNPGFSVKQGSNVDPSFWGQPTWDQHMNHVHAASYIGPGEGPGYPTGGAGDSGGVNAVGGALTGGRRVGASIYGGPGDPTSGVEGAYGHLPGHMAFAELSTNPGAGGSRLDFAALGHLAPHTKLKIGYNGRSVTGEKLDVGAGGGPVDGLPRAIDLWYETANALGFDGGLGVVDIAPAAMGGLFANGKMHTGVMDQGGWLMPGANLNWNGTGTPERVLPPSVGAQRLHPDDIAAIGAVMARITVVAHVEAITQGMHERGIALGLR